MSARRPRPTVRAVVLALLGPLVACRAASAAPGPDDNLAPPAMRAVDVEEHLGQRIDLDLAFTDDKRHPVRLGDYFGDGKPVVMILAYFRCPMLCDLVLQGIGISLHEVGWRAGEQYRVVVVSIDPKDTPGEAALKLGRTLQQIGDTDAAPAWHFLVGRQREITRLADRLGFRYAYDPKTDLFAHAAVSFVLTPNGTISRYLYGMRQPGRDLRLALTEAGAGRVGTIVDRVLLTCYRYDPALRRYGLFVVGFLRVGGALLLAAVSILLVSMWRRDRRRRRASP